MTLTGVDAARHRGAISAKGKRRSPCLARAWMGFIRGKFTTRGTDSGSRRRVDFGVSAGNLRCAAKFSHPQPHSQWNVDRGSSSSKPPNTPVRVLPLVAGGNRSGTFSPSPATSLTRIPGGANTGIKPGAKLVATWKGGGGGPCKRATTCFDSARLPESAEACAASLFPDEGSLLMKSEFWGLLKADASTLIDESVERLEKTSCRLPKSSPPCSNWRPAKSSRCRGRIL
jgi:hypothetical protein